MPLARALRRSAWRCAASRLAAAGQRLTSRVLAVRAICNPKPSGAAVCAALRACRWRVALAACATLSVARADEPQIEVDGLLSMGSVARVVLKERGRATSAWLGVGDAFAGYRIVAIELATNCVVLTRGDTTLRLPLKMSRLAESTAGQTDAATHGVVQQIRRNLRQLAAAAGVYFSETGKRVARTEELVGPGRFIDTLRPIRGEDYESLVIVPGQTLAIMTADGVSVAVPVGPHDDDAREFYFVRPGDSVEQLAARFGRSVQRLLEINELAEPGALRPGRLVRLN